MEIRRLLPAHGIEAAQELDIAPAHILHIGDRSDTDGVGAEAAGMKARILSLGKHGLPQVARPLEAALSSLLEPQSAD